MPPMVISNSNHRFIIAAQLQELGIRPSVHVLEPTGRNTAPAVAVALQVARDINAEGILLILSADHHIGDIEGFRRAIMVGAALADSGHIVIFGVTPSSPETGY